MLSGDARPGADEGGLYPESGRGIALVGIIVEDRESPWDVINALSGKLGELKGISVKTVCSNVGGVK